MQAGHRSPKLRSELSAALAACRGAFIGTGLISGMSNILMLTGALFMLEVYDRVLPSRSVPTLVGLLVLVVVLFAALGVLDAIRARILARVGAALDESLSGRVYDTLVRLPLRIGTRGDGNQPLRDLDAVRSYLSGLGPVALFDLPWIPLYLAICFIFHPLIGLTALGGAIVLIALTVATEVMTQAPSKAVIEAAAARSNIAEASRRNAEVLIAMGMLPRMAARWANANRRYLASQQQTSDIGGGLGSASKVLRMLLQSGVLAVGAWLVINQQASAGIIIASSILSARALAPVDLAIANWKGFVAARQSWKRLNNLLEAMPAQQQPMALPAPSHRLAVEGVAATAPGTNKVLVQEIAFKLDAGQGLGIIGPSGSGKSSLARVLVGVWPSARGKVRLDGAALDQWSSEQLGPHIGYLPQDVELMTGTVAENIARFEDKPDGNAVIAAAKAVGVHEMIVALPQGYETPVGEHGDALSAGQAQRVALARAVYRNPFLVVLDEPNSHLDADGDTALTRAILGIRERKGIVIVIAHRPSAIAGVDQILMLNQGRVQALGPKDEVLAKVLQRPPGVAAATPITARSEGGASA
ncbi:type I secretion system permease/ATPase [Undibacter mobilis]|uniref:Type I secretion system permease/ATPase n=1 Tax=Undibacter mobilis TaxID=2292256 RepID=A0A371B7W5_9BRAD|nr:type I secretion system permease/ATPase [Undibacter mobilis]RDV03543.1 type I secretion system permease/ATPase [Undibacter mobilis]